LLNAQAGDHMQRSRYREALALYEHAGVILDRTLGPEHPNRLTVTGNAAAALTQLARYDQAEVLGREVLEARERVLGAGSMEVAIARENLATVLANLGRFTEAEALLRGALATFEGSFAAGHWRIRNTLRNLGLIVALQGAPEEGLVLLDSAVAGTAEGDPSHAFTRGQRAMPLLRLGRLAEAARVAAAAAEIVDRSTPDGHVYRADIAVSIGIIALARSRPEEAERAFGTASAVLEPILAPAHPRRSQAACGLAVSQAWRAGARAGNGGNGGTGAMPDPPDACTDYARWGLASPLLLGWAGIDDTGQTPRG
jgi:tetratricopeptide (TPR) repeat protein